MGYIGAFLLAFCALPQTYKSYKEGHSEGLSHAFLWMWGIGEVLLLVYVIPAKDYPLILNYGINALLVAIILKYKYFPRL